MGTLSARNLTQALSQARNIGLVEEPFVVGDVSVVVRNLRPDQYDSIFKEVQGLSEVEYLNAWQVGHVSRAICELNGVDLREVQYVEEEEADPKRSGATKTVRTELHTWLYRNVLSTWSREILYICYRKVADAIEEGEKRAQEGVSFRTPDESAEDKYRRLIGEMKEVESEVPVKILDSILRDNGLVRRSTMDEIEAAQAKLVKIHEADKAAQGKAAQEKPAPIDPPQEKPIEVSPPSPAPTQAPVDSSPPSADRIAELLRNRVPLNQTPNPIVAEKPIASAPVVPSPPVTAPTGRTSELAALEGNLGLPEEYPTGPVNLQPTNQRPEVVLGTNQARDPKLAQTIIDTPPTGGINPRFRPPTL